jgi:hypothetical protein
MLISSKQNRIKSRFHPYFITVLVLIFLTYEKMGVSHFAPSFSMCKRCILIRYDLKTWDYVVLLLVPDSVYSLHTARTRNNRSIPTMFHAGRDRSRIPSESEVFSYTKATRNFKKMRHFLKKIKRTHSRLEPNEIQTNNESVRSREDKSAKAELSSRLLTREMNGSWQRGDISLFKSVVDTHLTNMGFSVHGF